LDEQQAIKKPPEGGCCIFEQLYEFWDGRYCIDHLSPIASSLAMRSGESFPAL